MYLDYFGLKELPFSIAPDPRYLFMSDQHREALAHLLYGVRSNGGFVLLTGEVGTGKTTVCRCFLGQLPEDCQVAFILNPRLSALELLAAICDEFCIGTNGRPASVKLLVDRINHFLLEAHASGRNPVLIIDEAQNLSVEVLEQIRLLTNLETDQRKLLQVILLGQPELRELLRRKELRQLSQRITARFHLEALGREEVVRYVQHRLAVAGRSAPLFPPGLLHRVHRQTGGIPRLVNLVCDRALLGASLEGVPLVSGRILNKAAREVLDDQLPERRSRFFPLVAGFLFCALVLTGGLAALGVLPQNWLSPAEGERTLPLPDPPAEPAKVAEAVTSAAAELPVVADPPAVAEAPNEPAAGAPAETSAELPVQAELAAALSDLAVSWDLQLADTGLDLCRTAPASGLACLQARGSFESLRRLDLPAVLTLLRPGGETGYAPLVALTRERGLVRQGEKLVEVSRRQLEESWLGDFTLLWRPPEAYRRDLSPGTRDPLLGWVARQLEAAGFLVPGQATGRLDGALLEAVRRFQSDAGLPDDGIVGPWTLILLGNRAGLPGPRLVLDGGAG